MNHLHSSFNRCIAIIALLLATAAASAQDYKIKLTRPDKIGDEYIATVTAKTDQTIDLTANGQAQPQKTDGFAAELHGILKVLSVSEKGGGASKVTCKVDKLTKDGAEVYPAGTVITAERAGAKTTFTVDGEKVDDEKSLVLDMVISVDSADRASNDDEQIGTDKPQKVGGTWPIDTNKVAKEITDGGLPITGDQLKGESKLLEVKKLNGTEVMVIETTLSSDHFKGAMPDGTAVGSGTLSGSSTSLLPTDGTSPMIETENKLHAEIHITLPGGLGKAVVTTNREVKEHRDEVKQ